MKANSSPPTAIAKLTKSYKGRYPFCLATTSFIYPDTWAANARHLGPYVDEIELLLLKSGSPNYPSKKEIKELAHLADDLALTYNIHLPMDIYLGHKTALEREKAVDQVRQVIDLTGLLPVSIYEIHAAWSQKSSDQKTIDSWQDRTRCSFEKIISDGIPAASLAVETLEDYPLNWLDAVIFDLGLSVCLDFGHLWLSGQDPLTQYHLYQNQTRILHLHGIENGKDHQSLERLKSDQKKIVSQILKNFRGVVSLEVFSLEDLIPSLFALERIYGEDEISNRL
jgi:sugar phosphate isomerase/epimerase